VVPNIEEDKADKETPDHIKNDVLEESNRVVNQDIVSEDSADSKALTADSSTEVLPSLSNESKNNDLEIDSSSSFNTPINQQESYISENSSRETEKISDSMQANGEKMNEEKEKKEQGEKKSRFGWFKKKK